MKTELTPMKNACTYRRLLAAKKFELHSELRTALEGLDVNERQDDMAAAFHDQFVNEQVANLDYTELKLVDAALDRLALGAFGRCQVCGCLIAARRLHAVPWAVRCLECEEHSTSAAVTPTAHSKEVFV
jgi:RNA polymerase-binding transcription factor DksA